MEKLYMLGTGSAMVTDCYNTCFTISNGNEHFLIDAGGGNTILSYLKKMDIKIENIHNMFISHNHNDHILGAIWIIRAVSQSILKENYKGNLNIYCHESSIEALKVISSYVLQEKFTNFFDKRIIFIPIIDGFETIILNRRTKFFDIGSTKLLQHGFTTTLENGKILTFLGDEPYRESEKPYAFKADYLLHEAFCLYSDREFFKPYEKHHATAKDACKNANDLEVNTVILYHTEDKTISKKEELYSSEGKEVFNGNIFAPTDLTIINL
ncbi:MAG: MBL fold metallo-hydrolase [Sarcina sp.]